MSLLINTGLLAQIQAHGAAAYPEEGAGFLLGHASGIDRQVISLLPAENRREDSARNNRYLLGPDALLHAEDTAARLGLELIGVFHSHPDHPTQPSEFDREWALPWFSYVITSVAAGNAEITRSWRLADDRSKFDEEIIATDQLITE